MRTILLLLVLPALALCADLPQWPALKLINGTEYKEVRVTAVEAGGLKVLHAGGIARIPETQLPPEIRTQFAFDPAKAAVEEQERNARDLAARQALAAETEQRRAEQAAAAERGKLRYLRFSFRVQRDGETGIVAYPHEGSGPVGGAGQAVRGIMLSQNPYVEPQQGAYNDGGTNWARPVFLEGAGEFAEGDIVTGICAEHGIRELNGHKLRRWVLRPGEQWERKGIK